MRTPQESVKYRIVQLEHQIAEMQVLLEQEKADVGTASWGTAGELGHIVQQLEEVLVFWRGGEVAE